MRHSKRTGVKKRQLETQLRTFAAIPITKQGIYGFYQRTELSDTLNTILNEIKGVKESIANIMSALESDWQPDSHENGAIKSIIHAYLLREEINNYHPDPADLMPFIKEHLRRYGTSFKSLKIEYLENTHRNNKKVCTWLKDRIRRWRDDVRNAFNNTKKCNHVYNAELIQFTKKVWNIRDPHFGFSGVLLWLAEYAMIATR